VALRFAAAITYADGLNRLPDRTLARLEPSITGVDEPVPDHPSGALMPDAAGQRSTSPSTPRRDRTGLTLPQAVQAAAGSAPPAQGLGLTIAMVSSWIPGEKGVHPWRRCRTAPSATRSPSVWASTGLLAVR